MVDVARPTVAVGCFVFDSRGALLLIQRGKQPGLGLWTIPGGRVEYGESLVEACRREVFEETGITVVIGEMVTIFEPVTPDFHYVIIDYLGAVAADSTIEPVAGDDAEDARWMMRSDLLGMQLTTGPLPVVEQAWSLHVDSTD